MILTPLKKATALCTMFMVCLYSCRKEYVFEQPGFRTDIPLKILYHPLNNPRLVTPYVTITINGQQNDVLFDTGSEGLRLMAGALHGAAVDTDQETVTYSYGYESSQLTIRGKIAGGNFNIGDLNSHSPLKFMRIDDTLDNSSKLWGSVRGLANFNNPHFRGLSGILGAGLRPGGSGVAAPFAQLPGNGSYIVEFPKYGETSGHVITNPTDDERAGFEFFQLQPDVTLLPNGFNSWQDRNLFGSLVIGTDTLNYYTLLDTGSPYTELYAFGLPYYGVQAGKHIQMRLRHTATGTSSLFNDFQATAKPVVGIDFVELFTSSGAAHLSYGTNLFFAFDVLFDQANGQIGLRKKY